MSDQVHFETSDEAHEALLLAALQVIESLSEAGYRRLRQPSSSTSALVYRPSLVKLADAIEAVSPGVIDRMYEIAAARKAHR